MIIFIITFGVYLVTLSPTVSVGDSGELITAGAKLGIAHPPGYPLYSLLGYIFTKIIPFGNIAYRINLMSGFFGALTCWIVYLIVRGPKSFATGEPTREVQCQEVRHRTLDIGHWTAFIPAVILGFSRAFWFQSVIAEVYTLNAFFVVLIIYLLQNQSHSPTGISPTGTPCGRFSHNSPTTHLLLAAFIFGIGCANHYIIFLFGPVYLIFIFMNWKLFKSHSPASGATATTHCRLKPATTLLASFCFFGFLLYLYLPVRSSINPPIDWGNPENLKNFLGHIFRTQYKGLEFSENVTMSVRFLFVKNFLKEFAGQFGPFIWVFSLFGFLVLIYKNTKLGILTLLIFLVNSLGLIFLLKFKFTPQNIEAVSPYYLPAYIMASIWLGYGFLYLKKKSIIFLPIIFLPLIFNFNSNFKRNDFIARDFANNILKSARFHSTLLLQDEVDETLFTLAYIKLTENKRQDLRVYDSYQNIFIGKADKEPDYFCGVNTDKIKLPLKLRGLLFMVEKEKEIRYNIWELYTQRFDREGKFDYRTQEVVSRYPYFLAMNNIQAGNDKSAFRNFNEASVVGKDLVWLNNNIGNALRRKKRYKDALKNLDRALNLDPEYSSAWHNLGLLYFENKENIKAKRAFKNALKYDPKDLESRVQIAKVYEISGYEFYKSGEHNKAVEEFESAVLNNPNLADAFYNLGVIYSEVGNIKKAKENFEIYLKLKPEAVNKGGIIKWLNQHQGG